MNPERRKQLLAGGLVVLMVIVLWSRLGGLGGGGDGDSGRQAGPSRRVATGASHQELVEELYLAALETQPANYSIGRNPWAFVVPPPPPPPPPPPVRTNVRPTGPPPPPPPVKPPLPQIDFRFLGTFGPENRRIAVFADGEQIINALQGDAVKQEFVVASIGLESVALAYVNHPNEPPARVRVGDGP